MKVTALHIALLGGVIALSVAFNLYQAKQYSDISKSLETAKNGLKTAVIERDSLQAIADSINIVLDDYKHVSDSLYSINIKDKESIAWLNKELNSALDQIDNITGDSAYVAVKEEYGSVLDLTVDGTYTFEEAEVKEIYKDAVRVNYLDSIRSVQYKIINRQSKIIDIKNNIISTLESEKTKREAVLEQMYVDMAKIKYALELSEADNRKLKNTLKLWKTGSISAGAALVGILLITNFDGSES